MTGRSLTTDSAGRSRRRFRPRLRDARIRSKLAIILVVPLLAVIALAGVRVLDGGQRATAAGLVHALAQVSAVTAELAHELHRERVAAAELLADLQDDSSPFSAQAARTDHVVEAYHDTREQLEQAPEVVEGRLERVDEQLGRLGAIRQEILGETGVTLSAAVLRYGVIIADLLSYQESVGQIVDDPTLSESVRAVAALSKAKAQMSEAQTTAFIALVESRLDEEQVTSFLATQIGQQEALFAFALAATPSQLSVVNGALTGAAVVFAERAAADVIRSDGDQARIGAMEASRALGAVVNLVRFSEVQLHNDQVALAAALQNQVQQQVVLESIAVVVVLIIAVVVAFLLSGILVRSLGNLREGALAVANRELPETVKRFSDPQNLGEHTPAQIASQVKDPIQLRSRDEIGQVAQAFNVVHQAAVRVAAEQAALRTSVSAMFLSLARRSQTLVDRMINQLDEIERNEEDPKRLSRLFALDHLATRMRRNDENLLVLAGADSGSPRTEHAPVPDILRAAQSEVEHYDRIEFGTVDSDVSVIASAVNDVVRLVAELFDNATRFSPPDSPAVAEARRLGDQVIIQVEDRGVGMPQEQANQLNNWLARPPAVEFTTFRRMGMAVVARLAARHGIRVELRSDPRSGTVVYVALPPSILLLPQHRSRTPEVPRQREATPIEQRPAPPLPARHLGQLPRRSAEVVNHAMRRRDEESHASAAGSTRSSTRSSERPEPRADQPVAGRPPEGLTRTISAAQAAQATHTAPSARSHSDHTVELPIFQEMEAVWFRSHGSLDLGHTAPAEPAAGTSHQPAPSPSSSGGSSSSATGADAGTDAGTVAHGYAGAESYPTAAGYGGASSYGAATGGWQTAADAGWNAAAKAAEPPVAGATRSGLPKRVPQAQLVPGGVDGPSEAPTAQRRSPDEVRGLLSAYHRGVQRGREHWGR